MRFDIEKTEQGILYGVLYGNEQIVFIKSGRGSDHKGYDGKYVKMAQRLHARLGCTVISASNPVDITVSFQTDKAFIERYVAKRELADFSLCLIGSSNGAYQNLLLAEQMPQTQALLCINMPLMINFQKGAKILRAMERAEKIFVYGTEDPSYSYVPFLEIKKYSACRILRVEGADHQFRDRLDDFIALSDLIE